VSQTQRLGGVCAATLTPLRADLSPDEDALLAHARALFAQGCDAINLLGTTGEAMSLSLAQRCALIDAIAHSDLPRSAMMVGTGANSLADAVELARRTTTAGFAGALVMPPCYYKPASEDGIVRFFDELLARVADDGLRIYLYNFPALSGIVFTPTLIQRLITAYPHTIVGLKDSSNAPGYADAIVREFPHLRIFPSSEEMLWQARERGFAGCISASVNLTASLAAAVWRNPGEAHADGRAGRLAQLRASLVRFPVIPALRYLLSVERKDPSWRRMLPPLVPLSDAQALELEHAFTSLRRDDV